jgi:ribose-phosphate pyrophosphokinase
VQNAVICTHGLFANESLPDLAQIHQVSEIITTDTVPISDEKRQQQSVKNKLTILSVAPIFGEAIWRNMTQQSIGDLFSYGENVEEY